jgi:hypothetical protein
MLHLSMSVTSAHVTPNRSSTNANSVMHSLDSLPNCTVFCITCTQPHVMTCSCVLITQTSPIQLALTTSSTFRDANFWTLNTVPRSHGSCISRNKRHYEACPVAGRYDNTGCRGHKRARKQATRISAKKKLRVFGVPKHWHTPQFLAQFEYSSVALVLFYRLVLRLSVFEI